MPQIFTDLTWLFVGGAEVGVELSDTVERRDVCATKWVELELHNGMTSYIAYKFVLSIYGPLK